MKDLHDIICSMSHLYLTTMPSAVTICPHKEEDSIVEDSQVSRPCYSTKTIKLSWAMLSVADHRFLNQSSNVMQEACESRHMYSSRKTMSAFNIRWRHEPHSSRVSLCVCKCVCVRTCGRLTEEGDWWEASRGNSLLAWEATWINSISIDWTLKRNSYWDFNSHPLEWH